MTYSNTHSKITNEEKLKGVTVRLDNFALDIEVSNKPIRKKMGLAETAQCECCSAEQTSSEHILQVCSLYDEKRCEVWTHDTALHTKLGGHFNDLRRKAGFADSTELTI